MPIPNHPRFVILVALILVMALAQPLNAAAQVVPPSFSGLLGGSGAERIFSIVAAPDGGFFVGGETTSANLPVSANALDRQASQREGFVARFNAAGQLLWLTYLGGAGQDTVFDLALGAGALYAVGETGSADFPGAPPARGDLDAFITAISLDGSALYYSTLIGGSDSDSAYALAVEGAAATLTGITYSNDLVASGYRGEGDAFVARINAAGKAEYIRLLGGRAVDAGFDVAVRGGESWVVGQTFSFNFPATGLQGLEDGFVVKLDAAGQVTWAKLLGGAGQDNAQGIAVDASGRAFVAGVSASNEFPSGSKLFGPSDAFLSRLGAGGEVEQSIRLGGSAAELGRAVALGTDGQVLLCGMTRSGDFPAAPNAPQKALRGKSDAFLASFSSESLGAPNRFFATFLGGQGEDACNSLAAPLAGAGLMAGESSSPDFWATLPRTGAGGNEDGFFSLLPAAPPAAAAPTATNALPSFTATPPAAATSQPVVASATVTSVPPSPIPSATMPVVNTQPPAPLLTPTIPLVYTPPPGSTPLPSVTPFYRTSTPPHTSTPSAATAALLTQTANSKPTQPQSTAQPSTAAPDGSVWLVGGLVLAVLLVGGWFLFSKRK